MKNVKYLGLIMLMVLVLTGCNNNENGGSSSDKGSNSDKESNNVVYYSAIKEVYFDPTTGKTCSNYGETNSLNETKTGCMKWYAYSENSNGTINMILDHNTTYKVDWSSENDNLNGPKEALEQLKKDTETWTGVPTRKDKYTNEGEYSAKVNNTTWEKRIRKYTIDYTGYKARLVTAQELALATGVEWKENSSSSFYFGADSSGTYLNRVNFKWLYNYTYGCQDADCDIEEDNTMGYWTAGAYSDSTAYCVSNRGWVNATNMSDGFGIRPVITIDKKLID